MQWKYRLFHGFIDDIMNKRQLYELIEFTMPKEYTSTVDDILNTRDYMALRPQSPKTAISVKLNPPGLSITFCQYLQRGLGNFFEPPTRITNARLAGTFSVNEVYRKICFHHLRAAGEIYYKKTPHHYVWCYRQEHDIKPQKEASSGNEEGFVT